MIYFILCKKNSCNTVKESKFHFCRAGVFFFFVTVVENKESRSLIRLTWRKLCHNTNSFVSSLKPRRSSSYPVGTPNHRPTTSLTPPSVRHHTVNTPVLGAKGIHQKNIEFSLCKPDENLHYL